MIKFLLFSLSTTLKSNKSIILQSLDLYVPSFGNIRYIFLIHQDICESLSDPLRRKRLVR